MNLTPLLLARRIPKLIRPSMRGNILSDFLPRDFGRSEDHLVAAAVVVVGLVEQAVGVVSMLILMMMVMPR